MTLTDKIKERLTHLNKNGRSFSDSIIERCSLYRALLVAVQFIQDDECFCAPEDKYACPKCQTVYRIEKELF